MSNEITAVTGSESVQALTGISNPFGDTASFNQLMTVANMFAASDIVPQNYRGKPENAMIAIDIANRLGVNPLFIFQNLYVVSGRPSWAGQACFALIENSGKFRDLRHAYYGKQGTDERSCQLIATRESDDTEILGPMVSIDMAKQEGWYQKSGSKWKTMPELMLAYRASAFFARVHVPSVLMGIHVQGEAEDIAKPETAAVTNPFDGVAPLSVEATVVADEPAPEQESIPEQTPESILTVDELAELASNENACYCEDCGKLIKATKTRTTEEVVSATMEKFGVPTCTKCAKLRQDKEKQEDKANESN